MNITVTKVLRELKIKHGYENMNIEGDNAWFIKEVIKDTIDVIKEVIKDTIDVIKEVIKDTIDVINDELIKHKNIKIKKN